MVYQAGVLGFVLEKFFLGGKTFIVLPPEFFEIIDLGKVEL